MAYKVRISFTPKNRKLKGRSLFYEAKTKKEAERVATFDKEAIFNIRALEHTKGFQRPKGRVKGRYHVQIEKIK